jgi:pimeloyl-ACP methyl ester carboxylesterase
MSQTFVLIHGTWHGGWAWQDVVRHLSRRGHIAHTPTLAGHGPGAMPKGITHQDCVDSVVACIRQCNLEPVVLVGHSFGGTVVQGVAERVPERIVRLVFVNALILKDGERVFDILPEVFLDSLAAKNGNQQPPVISERSIEVLVPPPWETWRDNFIQGAPEPLARSTWELLSPEPSQVNLDNIDLKFFYSLDIPKCFIFCRQDKAMPPKYFHPGMSSRLATCKLLEMDGSHEVMFTRPTELAEKLVEASTD